MIATYGAGTYGAASYGSSEPAPRRDLPAVADLQVAFSRVAVAAHNTRVVVTNG